MIKLKPRTRIILLSVISILIVVTIVLGVTYSFMQANIDSSSVTEVSLSSCAKITLSDTGASINLNNTNPISKNRALQTTPYTFTVTSSCESYVGFNMYLATLNTNTLVDSSIHYIITKNGSKDILVEGILSDATNALSEFTSDDQNQLNIGINGTFGTIYKLYNDDIPLQGEVSYDLYLYIDSEVTDASTMGKTFNAGIAVKSYDREADSTTLADYIMNEVYTGVDGENGLYYHDGQGTYTNADQEAGDNSYRYAGANPNNYVCFGSDEESCPADNLYRIIGVFENQVKLIKNASIGDYVWDVDNIDFGSLVNVSNTNSDKFIAAVQLGEILAAPTPGNPGSNNWEEADINYYINNDYLLNKLENKWQSKIATMSWQVGGNTYNNIAYQNAPTAYQNEIINPSLNTTYSAKIGLMYVSDYMYGSDPIYWTFVGYNSNGNDYRVAINDNWLYLGDREWTISRNSDVDLLAFYVSDSGFVNHGGTNSDEYAIRPVFYLESTVVIFGGTGTQSDPYRIA